MTTQSARRRLGALCLTVGGLGILITGALHPHVDGLIDYKVVLATPNAE